MPQSARSYAEIGEYWNQHDLSDICGKTRKVKFDVVLEPEATYYPISKNLWDKLQSERANSEFPLTLSTFYERHLRHCRDD